MWVGGAFGLPRFLYPVIMKYAIHICTGFLLILAIQLAQGQDDLDYCSRIKYAFSSQSQLIVNGETNVNTFACTNTQRLPSYEAIVCGNSTTGFIEFLQASLRIPVVEMDCGGKGINSDFREMMDADHYPGIILELWELQQTGSKSTYSSQYLASTSITLKNTKRAVKIPVRISKLGNGKFRVEGKVTLDLSDFDIKPPSPLMGLIKVSDKIEIQFELDLSLFI